MGLFVCAKCGSVENTALGWYWSRHSIRLILPEDMKEFESGHGLCTACLPKEARFDDGGDPGFTGEWHGKFPQEHVDEFLAGQAGDFYVKVNNNLLYRPDGDARGIVVVEEGITKGEIKKRVVGVIGDTTLLGGPEPHLFTRRPIPEIPDMAVLDNMSYDHRPAVELSPVIPRSTVGRNDPCPCGSGEKFKKCCINKPKST